MDGRALVDPHAESQAGGAQPPGEPRRVDHGGAVARRKHPRGRSASELAPAPRRGRAARRGRRIARRARAARAGRRAATAPWRRELTGALPAAVDALTVHGLLDRVEVLPAELLEHRQLVGEAVEAVAQPVGQAGRAEPAVATRGGPAHLAGLEQHHVAVRVALLGQQRGPQPGVAATDHGEVGDRVADQQRRGRGAAGESSQNGVMLRHRARTAGLDARPVTRLTRDRRGAGPSS